MDDKLSEEILKWKEKAERFDSLEEEISQAYEDENSDLGTIGEIVLKHLKYY